MGDAPIRKFVAFRASVLVAGEGDQRCHLQLAEALRASSSVPISDDEMAYE
jgi:hypothetical protein